MSARAANAILLVLCAVAPLEADEPWNHFVQKGSFRLHSEVGASEKSLLQLSGEDIFGRLESLQADIEATLGLSIETDDESRPINIYVFRTRNAYRRHLSLRVPEGARRQACYVQDGAAASVYLVHDRDLPKNLRHESTHALLHRSLPIVPLWLDEGLAVYFESPANEQAEPEHLARLKWALRLGWRPNLSELEGRKDLAAMSAADYRHAWAWVHFLLHESEESTAVLTDYLEKTKSGAPPASPGEWIRQQFPNAERRFLAHFDGWGK